MEHAKILIIDDQKEIFEVFTELLLDMMPNVKVETSSDPVKGLEMARTLDPSVIVLNVSMPGSDGLTICRTLKNNTRTAHIPIILLTAVKIDTRSRINGPDSVADAYLAKPIDSEELMAWIGAMLRIRESEDKLRRQNDRLEEEVNRRSEELKKSEELFPIFGTGIRPTCIGCTAMDVTKRKKHFRKIIQSSSGIDVSIDQEGRSSTETGPRILLMDDEEMVLYTTRQLLNYLGYDVETTKSGEEAVEVYQKSHSAGAPFDVVILDISVPEGMGARETVGVLKAINPEVSVIISSGFVGDPMLSNPLQYGFKGAIEKPYSLADLRKAMAKVFGNSTSDKVP